MYSGSAGFFKRVPFHFDGRMYSGFAGFPILLLSIFILFSFHSSSSLFAVYIALAYFVHFLTFDPYRY